MQLIISHENIDLDGLACLMLARKLHPEAIAVVHGSLDPTERAVFSLYRDEVPYRTPEELPEEEITELIVVDTHQKERVGEYAKYWDTAKVYVYDHHPVEGSAPEGDYCDYGSCVTLLLQRITQQGIELDHLEATLALSGLHSDTDHLRTANTKPEDYTAAAQLAQYADLSLMAELTKEQLEPQSQHHLGEILQNLEWHTVGQYQVLAPIIFPKERLSGAEIANRILKLTGADALFLIIRHEGKTDVIARGNGSTPSMAELMDILGGGGHAGAASASTLLPPQEVQNRIFASPLWHNKITLVQDCMTRNVKILSINQTVADGILTLERTGHNGAPVMHGDLLAGIISRRDLDRAMRHGLQNAPISSVMKKTLITISPDAPLRQAVDLIQKHSIGRLPVVEHNRLVGILTRSDLLPPPYTPPSTVEKVLEHIHPSDVKVLERLSKFSPTHVQLTIVGGAVRDALLGLPAKDLDVVVSGALPVSIAERTGYSYTIHEQYDNVTLHLGNRHLDLIQARDEFYAAPAFAPTVLQGNTSQDLARRDFTVNTLALQIHPEFKLLDAYHALHDLEERVLRILHPLSFIEDPSRIVRAARLAARLGFHLDNESLDAIPEALKYLTPAQPRLRSELHLVFKERYAGAVLGNLKLWGAEEIYGTADLQWLYKVDELRKQGEAVPEDVVQALWLRGFPLKQRKAIADRWQLPKRAKELAEHEKPSPIHRMNEYEFSYWGIINPELAQEIKLERMTPRKRVTGEDIMALGVPAGAEVGKALKYLEYLRSNGHVSNYNEEFDAVKRFIRASKD